MMKKIFNLLLKVKKKIKKNLKIRIKIKNKFNNKKINKTIFCKFLIKKILNYNKQTQMK